MKKLLFAVLVELILLLNVVLALTHTGPPTGSEDFLISGWDSLPFKEQRANLSYVQYVNDYLSPEHTWSESDYDQGENQRIALKCLSYGAATTNDWFKLTTGGILNSYQNFVNNGTEAGTNPRELESIYYSMPNYFETFDYAPLTPIVTDDVTKEYIPYNTKGYAYILTKPPTDWENQDDPEIGSFKYNVTFDEYLSGYAYKEIGTGGLGGGVDHLQSAIERYGIIYIQIYWKWTFLPVHALTLIGYDGNDFLYHDSFIGNDSSEFSRYGKLTVNDIYRAWAFYDPSWPTYHHDNRRTGFTLLKGDVSSTAVRKGINLVISGNIATDALARPSIANIDNDEYQDVVISFAKNSTTGWIIGLEKKGSRTYERWKKEIGYPVSSSPSLGNIDGSADEDLEVIVGLLNGTLIVIDPDGSKNPDIKWSYTVPRKYSNLYGDNVRGKLGYTTIADIDIDGKNEIIFTDYRSTLYDWKGTLYILEDNGGTYTEEALINLTADGDGGAEGAVSVANIDSDDNMEIVVPGLYGIKVYDYSSGTLTQKCNNTHGKIMGAPVIYDIDRDNQYEIIYTTADYNCAQTCYNKLYIINASSCTTEKTINTSVYSLTTPAISNLDFDSNMEIVIEGRTSEYGNYSNLTAYDANTGNQQWSYGPVQMYDIAPNIADINGYGNYETIVVKESDEVQILNSDGTNYTEFNVEGLIGSSPVIGDLSGKGVAELAVKRAGSPIAIFTMLTGNNSKPKLSGVTNITAIAGDLINLNESGLISATDPDNDNLTFYYSSPFNESGLWQSTINDSGNYSILVEASDGNLSDYQYAELIVFGPYSNVTNTFTDGTSKKSLSFTGGENQTVEIRLPKNASIIYSKIKLEGLAS